MRFSPATYAVLRAALALGLSLGASACFVDSRPDGNDDESGTTGGGTTTAGPASGISASASQSSTAPTNPVTTDPTAGPTTDPTAPDPTSDTGSGSTGDSSSTGDDDSSTSASTTTSTSTGEFALGVDDLAVGDLVITEVMNNPSCTADSCEWIEIYNATEFPVDLQGLGVGDRDDADSNSPDGLVTASVILLPGELAVLVQDADAWPYDVPFADEYGGNVAFTNGSPEAAAIFNGDDEVLDRTATFFGAAGDSGRSFILQPDFWSADANDNSGNWCLSDTPLESDGFPDDWGTPGSVEVTCATPAE